jgi:hypothetical protein
VSTVRVEAVLSDDSTAKLDDKTLESMVELMLRTQGVRTAGVTLSSEAPTVLAFQIGLVARDAAEALGRATALVRSCAGYSGLRSVLLRGGRLAD